MKILTLIILSATISLAVGRHHRFRRSLDPVNGCWKGAYGRGVGLVPQKCQTGWFKEHGLCYEGQCDSQDMNGGIYCWRNGLVRKQRKVKTPDVCDEGKENQAGLCYKKCENGYNPVGPVCWGGCPSGYKECGAACIQSDSDSACSGWIKDTLVKAVNTIFQFVDGNHKQGAIDVIENTHTQLGFGKCKYSRRRRFY